MSNLSTGIQFVNSITGSGTDGNIKTLIPISIDRMYHKQVQDQTFWKTSGLIGDDAYSEGGVSETFAGYPVIRKTELQRSPGDHIVMGQLRNLVSDPFNTNNVLTTIAGGSVSTYKGGGMIGNIKLVDAEQTYDFYHKKVMIDRQREGVANMLGMHAQRNPYKPLEQQQMELLSDFAAQTIDKELFFALHFGQSAHVLRNIVTGDAYDCAATPAAALRARSNVNLLVGNTELTTYATSALAQTQMNTSDTDFSTWRTNNKIGVKSFEVISAFARKNNFDLVSIGGRTYIVCLISPEMEFTLRKDTDFKEANFYAAERNANNAIFRKANYVFADCIIFVHNALTSVIGARRADQLKGETTGTISTADWRVGLSTTEFVDDASVSVATKIGQVQFLGSNSLALAEGELKMGKVRKEDDYEDILGRGIDLIYGCARMDWLSETGPGTTVVNQSSGNLIVGI